jgi:[CysO sulfur-carrier protein]-S-L-cysteine hydrolase
MKILLTPEVLEHLTRALRRAGRREIGGVLMGEHVADDVFRVVEITAQQQAGTHSCFVRQPGEHREALDAFFARTGHDYTRYNWLGEWHSHPSFAPIPSGKDRDTMQSIVEDPDAGVNFLVLLIPKLSWRGQLEASATAFRPHTGPVSVDIDAAGDMADAAGGFLSRVIKKIWR